jgi:hypothetical protein
MVKRRIMKTKSHITLILILYVVSAIHAATPKAIDQEIIRGESGVYVLYDDGFIQASGNAVLYGSPKDIAAVDLTLTPSLQGYYVLGKDGMVYSFGDAILIHRPLHAGSIYVDMERSGSSAGFYFLKNDGSVQSAGDAVWYGEFNHPDAVDLEPAEDGKGYYVLYRDGTIACFGSAVNWGYTQSAHKSAVDMELAPNGYYVLYSDGALLHFGDIPALPGGEALPAEAVAMTLTSRGYRILSANGDERSILRLEGQGTISWFAQSVARVVQPQATATPLPTPIPTPTPRADTKYFDLKLADYTEKVIGRLPQGVVFPTRLTTSQASVANGDTLLLVASGEEENVRQIRLFKEENFRNSDQTGVLFAEAVPERGAISIRGISYTKRGLIVALHDEPTPLLLLIEGPFEPAMTKDFHLQ